MHKKIKWLLRELEGWVARGLITPAQAGQIRALYPEAQAPPWGVLLFGGIGAVVAGLGVILLLAYNWQAIPKFGKLGLIFGALAGSHAAGYWLVQQTDWRRQLGEALGICGTMFFGAGIWLVAQIYHIDEHYPNGFLIWGLGALAMGWAVPSVAQGILASAILGVWGGCEVTHFQAPVHWAPLLILAGAGGLGCWQRSAKLLFIALGAFYTVWLLNAASGHGGLAFPAAYHVGALLVAVALLAADSGYLAPLRGVLRFYGWAAFLVCTYLLTFRGLVTDSLKWTEVAFATDLKLQTCLYGWGSFGLALLAWGKVIWDLTRQAPSAARLEFEAWLVPGTALAALLLAATGLYRYSAPGAALFNLVVLAVAATWMARGCREGELRSVWLGSGLLVAVAVARYFDLFESLAARGLVFLLVGGALFAEGFFYRRAQPADQERRAGS